MKTPNTPLIPPRFKNDFPMRFLALQAVVLKRTRVNLTPNELTILSAIYIIGQIVNVSELKKLISPWCPSYLHRKLRGLEKKGYLKREFPGSKSKYYFLTNKGMEILNELNRIFLKTHQEFLENKPRKKYIYLHMKHL